MPPQALAAEVQRNPPRRAQRIADEKGCYAISHQASPSPVGLGIDEEHQIAGGPQRAILKIPTPDHPAVGKQREGDHHGLDRKKAPASVHHHACKKKVPDFCMFFGFTAGANYFEQPSSATY